MSYLYALQMLIPNHAFNPIKIGFSTKPEDRARQFAGGPFPVIYLGYWSAPNGREDEKTAHELLKAFRLYGEWFYPSNEVSTFVEARIKKPTTELTRSKKVYRFGLRFSEMFAEPESIGNTPIPDPYDYPFPRPCKKEVEAAMQRLTDRWPVCGNWEPERQMIKIQELAELSGIDRQTIKDYMGYFKMGGIIRYQLKNVRDFLEVNPAYADQIAA